MKKLNLLVGIVMVASLCFSLPAAVVPPPLVEKKLNLVYWSMWNKTEPSATALTEIIAKFQAGASQYHDLTRLEWSREPDQSSNRSWRQHRDRFRRPGCQPDRRRLDAGRPAAPAG